MLNTGDDELQSKRHQHGCEKPVGRRVLTGGLRGYHCSRLSLPDVRRLVSFLTDTSTEREIANDGTICIAEYT